MGEIPENTIPATKQHGRDLPRQQEKLKRSPEICLRHLGEQIDTIKKKLNK